MSKGISSVLSAIQNGFWFIEKSFVDAHLPAIQNILKGDFSSLQTQDQLPSAFAIDPTGAVAFSPSKWDGFDFAKPGSIAVIPVTGAIMKYDYCGALGTQTLTSWLKQADANPNIIGVVLKIDSPGGTVAGTQDFANAVKAFSKPKVTYVEDLMASAALWGGINANEIYSNNKTARIGSIGTMLSFVDVQPKYEKEGYVFHEVYADDSTEKNQDYTEARKKNYEKVKVTLNAMNKEFVAAVTEARGEKLDVEKTTHGAMFMAEEALKYGLIDGIKSFEECVERVQELANQSTQNKNQSQSTMKIKGSMTALIAALLPSFATVKAGDDLTDEMVQNLNDQVATIPQLKTDLATANDTIQTLTTRAEKAEGDLATANTAKAKAETDLADLKAKHPGATETSKKETDDVTAGGEKENDFSSEFDNEVKAARAKLYGK